MRRSKKPSDRHRRKTVSFRLPEELMDRLRALALQNHRTLSGELEVALESHLAAQGMGPGADHRQRGADSPRTD